MKLHLPKALVAALFLSMGTAYANFTWVGGSQEFTSGDSAGWNSASNWQETIPSGVTVAVDGSGAYDKMVFDASKQTDGTLSLTTCKLEGWALSVDVLNGANVTVQDLYKIQGGGVINVDGISDVTIKKITGDKSDGDTLTFNLTSSATGHADADYAARASLILGSSGKGGGNTIVNYGEINGDKKYGFFTLASDSATDRNHSGSLVLQASLTQTIVSESTTLHTIALAEVSHISFGATSSIDFSGITSENFMLSTSALSESDEDIGKYYVWNDGGTIKLSYVTGNALIKNYTVDQGSAYAFTTVTGGADDVAALYLTVDPTPAPNGAATVNVTADSSVTNKLSVAGGTASVSVAEGATLTVGNLSLADTSSKVNFTGAGKVVLTQDVAFGNTTGANGTPAQASSFAGLGTLELAENVTLSLGTNDGSGTDRRVTTVNLADNVIMNNGSRLNINTGVGDNDTVAIASKFVMTNATIDFTDLASPGTAELSGDMVLHGGNTINAKWTSNQHYHLTGVISGDGSLTLTKQNGNPKDGYHFLLSGDNTYTGGTTIGNDVAAKGTSGSAFGSGAITNNGGIVMESTSANTTLANAISGTGSLTLAKPADSTGAYSYTLSGNNTYTGGTTINSGVTAKGTSGSAFGSGAITNNGGIVMESTSANTTLANAISGTGSLTLAKPAGSTDAYSYTLSGNNTFSGGTTINSGVTAKISGGSRIASKKIAPKEGKQKKA